MAPLALAALCAAAGPASAGPTDYLPDNLSWNGTSELASLARGRGFQIELLEQLDWSTLPADAALVVLYPLTELAAGDVVTFIHGGGRIVVADDFGVSDDMLRSLGIQRRGGSAIEADHYHSGNPHLPIASSGPDRHPIVRGVGQIVTNHPAYLTSSGGHLRLMEFSPGGGQLLLAATRPNASGGSLIALSDPSVLINGMLRFRGNLTLASNLMAHLQPHEADRIYLVTGHFRVHGTPRTEAPKPPRGGVQRFLEDYSQWLGRLNDFAPTEAAFRVYGIVLGGLAVVALVLLVPLPRRGLRGHWVRAHGLARADEGVEALFQPRPGRIALVAAMLRDEVEEVLTELLDAPGPVFTMHPSWTTRRVAELAGDEAARLCARTLSAMKHVSQNVSVTDVGPVHNVSRGDLAHMYELSSRLMRALGRPPLETERAETSHGQHR